MKVSNKKVKKAEQKISERLKDARINSGYSQQSLAVLAGVDRKTVNRIENGHFSPNMATFVRLCSVLKVKPSAIVRGI